MLLPVAPSLAAQELADDAALDRAEYQSLKRYSQLDSADKVAESNLRVQQVVQTALTFSPATREIMAGAQAAGLDVLAAKGAKLPQVTLTGQSIVTEGDLALASKKPRQPRSHSICHLYGIRLGSFRCGSERAT